MLLLNRIQRIPLILLSAPERFGLLHRRLEEDDMAGDEDVLGVQVGRVNGANIRNITDGEVECFLGTGQNDEDPPTELYRKFFEKLRRNFRLRLIAETFETDNGVVFRFL